MSSRDAPPRHVAIVGCGYTGTSAFYQLVDRYQPGEITIFEKSGEYGPGYPYWASETPDYLINNTADTMGIEPGNRRGFIEWLASRPDLALQVDRKGHYPRALFGVFLNDIFHSTLRRAKSMGIEVRLVPHEVVNIAEPSDGSVVLHSGGEDHTADMAILSTGRCPDRDAYGPPKEKMTCRYYPTHIPGSVLDDVPLDATCHVLGASLSAYDVVNRLFSHETGCRFERGADGHLRFVANGNDRRLVLCSRSGLLKKMQSRHPGTISRENFTSERIMALARRDGLTLGRLADLVKRDAKNAGAAIDWDDVFAPYNGCETAAQFNRRAASLLTRDIEAAKDETGSPGNFLVDYATNAQIALWDAFATGGLGLDEELAYRNKFETRMLTYIAACPIETAERVLALMKADRLSLVRGVGSVRLNEKDDCYDIENDDDLVRATVLINTTGSVDRRVDSSGQDPIIAGMRESGLARPYTKGGQELDGISVDMQTFRLHGARNIYVANQFLWGPGFFVSSAYMMATIVSRILEQVFAQAGDSVRNAG